MPQSKDQKIANAQANLPLPEQPPTASDWQSADARTVNVGAGGDVARKEAGVEAGVDAAGSQKKTAAAREVSER